MCVVCCVLHAASALLHVARRIEGNCCSCLLLENADAQLQIAATLSPAPSTDDSLHADETVGRLLVLTYSSTKARLSTTN